MSETETVTEVKKVAITSGIAPQATPAKKGLYGAGQIMEIIKVSCLKEPITTAEGVVKKAARPILRILAVAEGDDKNDPEKIRGLTWELGERSGAAFSTDGKTYSHKGPGHIVTFLNGAVRKGSHIDVFFDSLRKNSVTLPVIKASSPVMIADQEEFLGYPDGGIKDVAGEDFSYLVGFTVLWGESIRKLTGEWADANDVHESATLVVAKVVKAPAGKGKATMSSSTTSTAPAAVAATDPAVEALIKSVLTKGQAIPWLKFKEAVQATDADAAVKKAVVDKAPRLSSLVMV